MSPASAGRRWRFVTTKWGRYGGAVLVLAAAHALVTAVLRLSGAFDALVLVPDAPIDLLIRMDEAQRWFRGVTIYFDPDSANYPPASYAFLWPLIGWLPERGTRILFAASLVAAMLVIAVVTVRASGAAALPERAFAALLVLPLGATQITVWIGQLGLHVTACLLGATALLFGTAGATGVSRAEGSQPWRIDLTAAALLAASLVKPTLSVPVVAALLILAGRWRPALLVGVMYGAATMVAAGFQEHSAPALVLMWLGRESVMNLPLGSVNTHLWLHWIGVRGSMLPASLLWLAATAAWAWRCRRVDPWIVVGVAALVGRLWIHHRSFDDVLLVIPAIALFRIAAVGDRRDGVTALAVLLLAAIYGLGHAPWSYVSGAVPTLWLITEVGRTVAWVSALAFLVWQGHRMAYRRGEPDASAS